jgi:hypothetical protein
MALYKDIVKAFLTLLKYAVLFHLEKEYPTISAFSSFEKPEKGSERELRSQKGEPREWVSFPFNGYDFWDLHLGIVLKKQSNRVVVGLHISKKIWPTLQEKVTTIPWDNYPFLRPTYLKKEELNEHRFEEPEISFDVKNIGEVLQEVINKTIIYYRAVRKSLDSKRSYCTA